MTKTYTEKQLGEIYSHEIRNMIVRLLRIHKELSLAQLRDLMNMNKTTIQYHLKILREKDIIYESKESQEDSRGSIPTKYYQLKIKELDYHQSFSEIKNMTDLDDRLISYQNHFQSLNAGLKDVRNLISYAEEVVEQFLSLVEEYKKGKITKKLLDELHFEFEKVKTATSFFSTTRKAFFRIQENVPKIYKKEFERIHKEENETTSEGFEIITLTIPLVSILESRFENKNKENR